MMSLKQPENVSMKDCGLAFPTFCLQLFYLSVSKNRAATMPFSYQATNPHFQIIEACLSTISRREFIIALSILRAKIFYRAFG